MFYFGYFLSCQQIETNEEESIAQSQLLRGMKLLTYSSSTAYIGGPPKSGKTSLLFQYIYGVISSGGKVSYLCQKNKIQNNLPSWPGDFIHHVPLFNNVDMVYINDNIALIKYLTTIQLLKDIPDLIVIDDFGSLFREHKDKSAIYKAMALIKETADYITAIKYNIEKIDPLSKPIGIIICDSLPSIYGHSQFSKNSTYTEKRLHTYKRWFPLILTINEENEHYELKFYDVNTGEYDNNGTLKYSFDKVGNIIFHQLSFIPEYEQKIEIVLE